MDLTTFRTLVDQASPGINKCGQDLHRLYDYVGLPHGSFYTQSAVRDELYAQIQASFSSGHAEVRRVCRQLQKKLISESGLCDTPLDPYFEILEHLRDAVRSEDQSRTAIDGNWSRAIQAAYDDVQLISWGQTIREKAYNREFQVAKAARLLKDAGYEFVLEQEGYRLSAKATTAVARSIEDRVDRMGGLNLLRRIFTTIKDKYDHKQERYHLVKQVSTTGEGTSQMPWGYLLQLSAKHINGLRPYENTDIDWKELIDLTRTFSTVIDVQYYVPPIYGYMDATELLPFLQDIALYDTLFRLSQMRPSDIRKIAIGMFDSHDLTAATSCGWSINQVLEIIEAIMGLRPNIRGPIFIQTVEIERNCPAVPKALIRIILEEILCHPISGANRNFLLPTDGPVHGRVETDHKGPDFFKRPLLRHSQQKFILLDRSLCAGACLEALLTALRCEDHTIDEKVGLSIERFLVAEFGRHGIPVLKGDYDDVYGDHGECDLVLELPGTVVFAEVKKKALTTGSKAGADSSLLLDFAGSLVSAQSQAGEHEVRIRRDGHLNLFENGKMHRLELDGREVERVAISLFDYGSFQDRIFLQKFFVATMAAEFSAPVASVNKKLKRMNADLVKVREQVVALQASSTESRQPFFNCWFISVPQVLILLDDIIDPTDFKSVLWSIRHTITGSSDVYFDIAYWKRIKAAASVSENRPA